MRTLTLSTIASLVGLALLGPLVGPQLAVADDSAAVSDLRREVADLRREISDLRREIYALRLDLLSAIRQLPPGGAGAAPHAEVPAAPHAATPPLAAPAASPPAAVAETGPARVVGRVEMQGGKAPAYVYVENVPVQLVKGAFIDIKQSGRQFQPRFAVVQAGTKVNFPNLDSTYHNVFSKTPGSVFDLGIYRAGDPTRSYTMTSPGVIDVFCDMHSDMSASVLVVPSKLYVAADAEGRFTLENVPRGSRRIVAWAPGFELAVSTVNVTGKETAVDFTLKPKSAAHTNKAGLPYGSYK